jgi:hypothetical protein
MALGSSMLELKAAVYRILAGDTALKNMTQGVYDAVAPSQTLYPYVVLGEWTEGPNDLLAREGRECTVALHIYSRYSGSKEISSIFSRVLALLGRSAVTAPSWNVPFGIFETANTLVEDNETQHLIARFRWKLSPK